MNENKTTQLPVFLLSAALVFTPLFFLPVVHSFITPRLALVEVVIIFIIALYLIEGHKKPTDIKLFLPWGLMNIIFFASVFSSPSLLTGWKVFIYFFLMSTFSIILSSLHGVKRRFDLLLFSILVPGFLNSIYLLIQYHGIDFTIMKNSKFFVMGTLGSPGMLGGYLSLCCIISFHCYTTSKNKLTAFLTSLFTLFFLFVSALTLSRTSLISIAGGLFSYLIFSFFLKKSSPGRFSKSLAGIVLILFATSVVLIPSTGIFKYAVNSNKDVKSYFFNRYKSNSVLQRRLIWKSAIEIIKDNPISGAGAGAFFYEYPKAQAKVLKGRELNGSFPRIASDRIASYAHNDFLQLASETGLPGLAAFLLFPFFSMITMYKRCRNRDPYSINYGPLLFSGIVAVLIQSLFDFPLYMPASAFIFWLFLGASHIKSFPSEHPLNRISLPFRFVIYATTGILAFTVCMPLISAIHLSYADKHIVNGDIFKAKLELENALAFDPSEPDVYVSMGRLERIKGNFSQSMKYYDEALQLSNNPSHFYGKGMAAFLSGNLEEAKDAFSSVLDIDPRSTDAMMALSLIYFETEDAENALLMLRNILIVDPSNKEALNYIKNLHVNSEY